MKLFSHLLIKLIFLEKKYCSSLGRGLKKIKMENAIVVVEFPRSYDLNNNIIEQVSQILDLLNTNFKGYIHLPIQLVRFI